MLTVHERAAGRTRHAPLGQAAERLFRSRDDLLLHPHHHDAAGSVLADRDCLGGCARLQKVCDSLLSMKILPGLLRANSLSDSV